MIRPATAAGAGVGHLDLGQGVVRELIEQIVVRGKPGMIVSDTDRSGLIGGINPKRGTELAPNAMFEAWL